MNTTIVSGEQPGSRTAEIAKILGKYGFDFLADSRSPWSFLGKPKQWFSKDDHTQPEKVRLALEELGATYIKLGQAISTRTDLVPPEYIVELAKLQDDAPSVPYHEVASVIHQELGKRPEEIFREFRQEPEAAASIGQVHRATLVDGSDVVVKIQRPGVDEQIERDLEVMEEIAKFVASNTQFGKSFNVLRWFEEFAYTLRNELDYLREGRNADRFRMNFSDDPDLYVPMVHWQYTTQKVITMERVVGIKISDQAAIDAAGINRRRLAETCACIVLTEIFKHGFFHADPHPGNFFVRENGTVILLDTGMVGRLDNYMRSALMRITLALARKEADDLAEELLTIGQVDGPIQRQDLRRDLNRLIYQHFDTARFEFSLAQALNDTLHTAGEHNIQVPSELLTLARTIAMSEGLGKDVDPTFEMMSYAENFLKEHYLETRSPKAITSKAQQGYMDAAEVAIDLPKRLRRLFGQLERGEITFTARLEKGDELMNTIEAAANRLSMSVLLAGVVVGISVLLLAFRPERFGIGTTMLQIFMALVVASAIVLFISIWKSGNRH